MNVPEEFLLTSESKAVVVLLWIARNKDSNNIIHTTLDSVAEECGVTKVTVNKTFQKLYKTGFLVKERNSRYKVIGV